MTVYQDASTELEYVFDDAYSCFRFECDFQLQESCRFCFNGEDYQEGYVRSCELAIGFVGEDD